MMVNGSGLGHCQHSRAPGQPDQAENGSEQKVTN